MTRALILAARNERHSELLRQEPEYAIELHRQHAQIQKMAAALRLAEDTFRTYSDHHAKKGGTEKRAKNYQLAIEMQAAQGASNAKDKPPAYGSA